MLGDLEVLVLRIENLNPRFCHIFIWSVDTYEGILFGRGDHSILTLSESRGTPGAHLQPVIESLRMGT